MDLKDLTKHGLSRRFFLQLLGLNGLSLSLALRLDRSVWASAQQKPLVTVATQPGALGHHINMLGMQIGGLERLPFELKIIWGSYGAEVVQNYVSGRADIGQAADIPTLTVLSRFTETTIIATTGFGQQDVALVSPKEVNKVEELEGKVVAVPLGSTAEWLLRELLKKHGMTDRNIEIVAAGPQAALTQVKLGHAIATPVWEPWITLAERRMGLKVLAFGFGTDYVTCSTTWVRNDFLKKNEEIVQAFCDAYVRSYKLAYGSPELVARAISNAPVGQVEYEIAYHALLRLQAKPGYNLPEGTKNAFIPWHRDVEKVLTRANKFMEENPPAKGGWPGVKDIGKHFNNKYIRNSIMKIAPDLYAQFL